MKKFLSLLLVLVLTLSLSVTAFAADSTATFKSLEEGWAFAPGSEYSSSDLFDGFKGVMPGDKLTESVKITNEAADCDYIKVYLTVDPHDEEAMQAFLSQLSMRIYNGEELIYESSPDQAGALAESTLLGTLFKGDSLDLTVELDVPKDLGNEFANATGEVDWIFLAEGYDYEMLTVHKVWEDNNYPERPESITVTLFRDGKAFENVTLNEENQWTYTWDKLEELYTWTVEETEVPELYEVSYKTEDTTVFITNSYDYVAPPDPVDLTVRKIWNGTVDKDGVLPSSVTVTLYNGTEVVEKVKLSAENKWTYSWEDLDGSGDWSVLETGIPKGYVPSYKTSGDTVTITNTASLIQTGQLNWPILLLGILGLLMIGFGVYTMSRKRKNEHA